MEKKFKFRSKEKEMMIQEQKTLRLPDGRNLCYAEFGDPDGVPVMLIHGSPGHRLFGNIFLNSLFCLECDLLR